MFRQRVTEEDAEERSDSSGNPHRIGRVLWYFEEGVPHDRTHRIS